MLEWFEVENFKSIRKLRIEFRPFMVFVGPNAAGKSNVLEALGLLLEILRTGSLDVVEARGGFDTVVRHTQRPRRSIRLALGERFDCVPKGELLLDGATTLRFQTDLSIERSATVESGEIRSVSVRISEADEKPWEVAWEKGLAKNRVTKGRSEVLFRRLADSQLARGVDPRGRAGGAIWECREWAFSYPLRAIPRMTNLRLDSSALRADTVIGDRTRGVGIGEAGEGLALAIERLRGKNGKKSAVLAQILDDLRTVYPRISDVVPVRFSPGRVSLTFRERDTGAPFGERNASDGLLHALALLVALHAEDPNEVLAIEEPENALHPWVLRRLIERAQQRRRTQPLMLTTHSAVVVDAVKDPACLFIVEHGGKSGTKVTPATVREKAIDAILRESGQGLGDVWLDGSLGGVPTPGE